MKNYIYIIILMFWGFSFSQSKKEKIYLLFEPNNSEKFEIEDGSGNILNINKYRKKTTKNYTTFYILEESFVLDKKDKIDTCSIKHINKIKFETLQTIKNKRKILKSEYFFKNSIFKKIYLIERFKDKIIKYPVIWNTDLIK
tara:strand:- start:56 stop:481 length:426 start_codon:yes stop_codon:yes gene_type:complete